MSEAPARIRGRRAGWIAMALLALGTTALPWSCTSPLRQAGRWAAEPPPVPLFALGVALPIVLLALTAMLEARAVPPAIRRGAVLVGTLFATLALAIGAFGDRLAPRGFRIGRDVVLECPAPIAFFHAAPRALLVLALIAPLALGAFAARRPPWAALALRVVAAHAFSASALLWSPYCGAASAWPAALVAGLALALAAPFLDDGPDGPPPRARTLVALAAALLFALEAGITLPHRGEFARAFEHADAAAR